MNKFSDSEEMLKKLECLSFAQVARLAEKYGVKKSFVEDVSGDGEFGSIYACGETHGQMEEICEKEGLYPVTETLEDSEGDNGEDLIIYSFYTGLRAVNRERFYLVKSPAQGLEASIFRPEAPIP